VAETRRMHQLAARNSRDRSQRSQQSFCTVAVAAATRSPNRGDPRSAAVPPRCSRSTTSVLEKGVDARYIGMVADRGKQTVPDRWSGNGKGTVEVEQRGKKRAKYGEEVVRRLAARLSARYGQGFSYLSVKRMKQVYLPLPKGSKSLRTSVRIRKAQQC